jgi:hypothetical protein
MFIKKGILFIFFFIFELIKCRTFFKFIIRSITISNNQSTSNLLLVNLIFFLFSHFFLLLHFISISTGFFFVQFLWRSFKREESKQKYIFLSKFGEFHFILLLFVFVFVEVQLQMIYCRDSSYISLTSLWCFFFVTFKVEKNQGNEEKKVKSHELEKCEIDTCRSA